MSVSPSSVRPSSETVRLCVRPPVLQSDDDQSTSVGPRILCSRVASSNHLVTSTCCSSVQLFVCPSTVCLSIYMSNRSSLCMSLNDLSVYPVHALTALSFVSLNPSTTPFFRSSVRQVGNLSLCTSVSQSVRPSLPVCTSVSHPYVSLPVRTSVSQSPILVIARSSVHLFVTQFVLYPSVLQFIRPSFLPFIYPSCIPPVLPVRHFISPYSHPSTNPSVHLSV